MILCNQFLIAFAHVLFGQVCRAGFQVGIVYLRREKSTRQRRAGQRVCRSTIGRFSLDGASVRFVCSYIDRSSFMYRSRFKIVLKNDTTRGEKNRKNQPRLGGDDIECVWQQ